MESVTLESLYCLKEELSSDPRVLALNELEKRIQNDEEVSRLSALKDQMADEYEETRAHYGENSDLAKAAQKKLFEAKLNLDSHPLVKEYNAAYSEVAELYRQIDDILFGFLRTKKHCGGKL